MAWIFGDNDALRVRQWSELVIRDAEKLQVFAPLMYSIDAQSRYKAADASKATGVIRVHEEFESQAGDRVTIANTARVTGKGIIGDALLRDTGSNLNTFSMDVYIQPIAQQLRTSGPLNDQRVLLNRRKEFRMKLAAWAARTVEEAIIIMLSGLTTWSGTPYENWDNNGENSIFGNTVTAFDTSHIVYGGDATSVATVDSNDVMSAQLLTKLQTVAIEDLSVPIEPLKIDGEDAFMLMCSYRAIEQLQYDPDYVNAQRANTYNKSNPLLTGVVGKYGMCYLRPYPKIPNVAANVSQALLLGQDALHLAKKDDWSWWEGYEDNAERRKVMAISAFLGLSPTYFDSSRRNAMAVRHYVRT